MTGAATPDKTSNPGENGFTFGVRVPTILVTLDRGWHGPPLQYGYSS